MSYVNFQAASDENPSVYIVHTSTAVFATAVSVILSSHIHTHTHKQTKEFRVIFALTKLAPSGVSGDIRSASERGVTSPTAAETADVE